MLLRPLLTALLSVALVALPAAPAGAAPVTKRLAVVLIQNGSTDTKRTQLADTAYFRTVFFSTTGNTLATWMPAVTHGLLSYTPAGDGVFLAEPNDALRNGAADQCHSGPARTTAEDHLKAIGVSYDSVAVVFDIGSCGWGGLGQMPGRVTWYPPKPSLSAIVHEFGHNQGYPHEPKRDCAGGQMSACTAKDYSGNTPMGSGGAAKGYSSVELLHSGWVEPGWLMQASKPGVYSLKPLYSPASVTGTRVVEYKASTTLTYVIETRAAGPEIDTGITNPGVRVYAVAGKDYKNGYLVNPGAHKSAPHVATGVVITDTANKLTISVRSSSVSGAQVAIEAIVAPKPSPSAPLSPSSAAPLPSSVAPSPEPSEVFEDDIEAVVPVNAPDKPRSWWLLIAAVVFALLVVAGGATLLRRAASRPRSRHRRRGWIG